MSEPAELAGCARARDGRADRAGRSVVSVRGLRKSYGDLQAVRGIDFEVEAGEIFALVGSNGAGKTTTVEILEGYRPPDAGEVAVLGTDPARAGRDWNARIGVMLQMLQVQPELTVRESLEQFAGYYPAPRPIDETIALVGLVERRDVRAGRLSGGQQRRLDLALALIGDPELSFMDEPTTGFNPAARRRRIAEAFPVKHLYDALLTAFDPSTTGGGIEPTHVSVVSAWGLAGLALALRTFRWAPRSTG